MPLVLISCIKLWFRDILTEEVINYMVPCSKTINTNIQRYAEVLNKEVYELFNQSKIISAMLISDDSHILKVVVVLDINYNIDCDYI